MALEFVQSSWGVVGTSSRIKVWGWRNLDATKRSIGESLWWQDLSSTCNLSEEGSWLRNGTKWDKMESRMWIKGLVRGRWMEDGVLLKEKYPRLY